MGYSTSFTGELKFTKELNASTLAHLKKFLGEDARDNEDWLRPKDSGASYIDLELTDDFSGLKWNGAEKTYGLEDSVTIIIMNMRLIYPDFGLTGELLAQGEDFEDKWVLKVIDGVGIREEIKLAGDVYKCPHCEERFLLKDATKIS